MGDGSVRTREAEAFPEQVSVVNLANAITVARLALVPLFAACLVADDGHSTPWRIAATVVFGVAALSDRFDGEIARRRGLVTEFGKIADPIADKALTGTALIGLSALRELPWWITIVVLSREIGVTLLRFWVIHHGIMTSSRGGKLKTALQGVAIGLYVIPVSGPLADARFPLMMVAVAVTVLTGAHYVGRAWQMRQTSIAPGG